MEGKNFEEVVSNLGVTNVFSDALYSGTDTNWRMKRFAASFIEQKGKEFFSSQKENFSKEELIAVLTAFNEVVKENLEHVSQAELIAILTTFNDVITNSEESLLLSWAISKHIADMCYTQ